MKKAEQIAYYRLFLYLLHDFINTKATFFELSASSMYISTSISELLIPLISNLILHGEQAVPVQNKMSIYMRKKRTHHFSN